MKKVFGGVPIDQNPFPLRSIPKTPHPPPLTTGQYRAHPTIVSLGFVVEVGCGEGGRGLTIIISSPGPNWSRKIY